LENTEENSKKIGKICQKIGNTEENSEKIWKIRKKILRKYEKYRRNPS
jgi:hypothetical protein